MPVAAAVVAAAVARKLKQQQEQLLFPEPKRAMPPFGRERLRKKLLRLWGVFRAGGELRRGRAIPLVWGWDWR